MASTSEVQADLLWKHLESICKWERYTGTTGENQAVAYIERELGALGIEVVVHEYDALISIPGKASLEILGPGGETIPAITPAFGASTGDGGVTGDAAYVGESGLGPSITGETAGEDQAGPPSVAGRIVVAERMVSPGRFFEFERAGAIAQVYVNMGVAHEMTVSTIWGSPTPESVGRMPRTPVVTLSREQGEDLIRRLKAREEVKLCVQAQNDTRWRRARMPVATVPGPADTSEYAIVGGHIDSWQFGANDNSAGDATLMELARIIHAHRSELRRGLKVIWWNGHSHGRFSGSTWFADHMFDDLRENCVAYLNIDQPGCRDCTLYKPFASADIAAWVKDVILRIGGQDTSPRPPMKMADQSFWGVGIPSYSFLPVLSVDSPDRQKDNPDAGFPWYWHNPADTLDKMDRDIFAEHCRLYAGALLELCTSELVPLDARTIATVVREELGVLERRAKGAFDLGPVGEASERFSAAAEALMKRIGSLDPVKAGRTLRRISQVVNPVLYTQNGPFDQDPASGAKRLPGLHRVDEFLAAGASSHEGRVIYTRLVRERNRVCQALKDAAEIASSV